MSTDHSDATPSTSHPPPKPKSPPFADAVVRPFTSQGGTFSGSLDPVDKHARAHSRSGERPSSVHDSQPSNSKFGPYTSASARTSYTRVDVDSLSQPVYPPLPPLPAAFMAQDATPTADATAPDAATPVSPTPPSDTQAPVEPPIPQTPQVSLTFLLVSGHRKTQSFDPETTVGRVKELVWNAWPARDADWQDERPPAPSYLRILYLGKILQDDDTLLRVGFSTSLPSSPSVSPTIVHLSIRPYGLPADDPALSKKRRLSVAISRRFSSAAVAVGGGGRDVEHDVDGDDRRAGCCTGCTIC